MHYTKCGPRSPNFCSFGSLFWKHPLMCKLIIFGPWIFKKNIWPAMWLELCTPGVELYKLYWTATFHNNNISNGPIKGFGGPQKVRGPVFGKQWLNTVSQIYIMNKNNIFKSILTRLKANFIFQATRKPILA